MKLRYPVIITLCLAAYLPPAQAASFDCQKASTPVEQAICSDDELSGLDEQLNHSYSAHLNSPEQDAAQLKSTQRAWLRKNRQRCETSGNVRDCLSSAYRERLDELGPSTGVDPRRHDWKQALRIANAATGYDFLLDMQACTEATCEGPAYLGIQGKGGGEVTQAIYLPNVFLTRQENGEPLVNSARLYDYQGVINAGDFNFDGHPDFAVQNGNRGSYGGPSYDVFLFDSAQQRFIHSPALSGLTLENLGFFDIDRERKRLITFAKSGCCYHEKSEYIVQANQPIEVKREIEDATGGSSDPDMVLLSTEELVDGQWKTTSSRKAPFKEIYGDQ